MESANAHKTLLRISKEKKFDLLEKYLQKSEPVEINLSSLPLVEYLSSVVVSQQLSTKAAKTIWSRVHPIIKTYTHYQNLETKLHSAGLSKSKANYVIGLINNLNLSSLQRSDLKELSNIEFENLLIANKGIGPWSVHMARMFFLGDTDIIPINDLGIKHAHEYFFSEHEMSEKFYEPFRPWRSYLSLLMWKSLS
jgi:DNA-3-methyladenine glycosylase II